MAEHGDGYTIMHRDELERPWPQWRLARSRSACARSG
jgi:hypothetical protein